MARESKTWRCGKHTLTFDRPRIMGILNVTPDSFSDGGENFDQDAAIARGIAMLDEGADIIDVGGESTRPGFTPVSADEEARRVLPVVRALVAKGAIVSIDTRHVEVAKAAVRMGAAIVNDVTGFTDPKMVEFVANNTCGVVVMHAGELAEPERAPHTAVTLDTSAAAYMAEREAERQRAEAEGRPVPMGRLGRPRGGKVLGEPRLKGGAIQQRLPFGDIPNGSAAGEADAEAAGAHPAGEAASADEVMAAATSTAAAVSTEAVPGAEEAPSRASTGDAVPSNDELAAIMRRAAERRGATAADRVRQSRFTLPDSAPIMRRVMGFLSDQARSLVQAGVARDRICIDPGAGFGKSANEDIVIQRETAKMVSLGYPLMCAVSRKRVVGAVSGVSEASARDAATYGMCLGAIEHGANVVRVHDVAGFAQFLNGYWAVAHPQPRRAFVALGSNMGRRLDNIRAARDLIAEIPLTCVFSCSRIYESEPAYVKRQDPFANAVVEIRTELSPLVLLDELMAIENRLGRNRTPSARANGPRMIDCDLLWVEGESHGGDKLRLPHPRLGERDFVLVPLEDLVHDPARFFRYEGVQVLEPEERVGHVVRELGQL
ncbi:dihydropteroate synthase [Collinsella intestinalis]|uniref:dihydropteroate synthase n=1 Tax=Collinsella intestinalis TaxID=147207 RepID=UPI00195C7FEB|nr:dihydropteroate synthase [Collinsella intestinalis]MBM6942001.1 dihydropteroate synthase [Collinsella intestinalis]